MAFSLSPRAFSRAMGCYGYPFVLFAFLKLFGLVVFLSFLPKIFVGTIVMHQEGTKTVQRNNLVRMSLEDRGARHPTDYAGVFALGNGHAADALDGAQTLGAVITHAGHEQPNGSQAKFLGDGV